MVDLEKPAYRAATARMLASVRLVLVRSESLRKALVSLGCPADKIRLQRTGIPLSEIAFRPRAFPQDGHWHLLQAGRLIEKKGFRTSLRAFAEFARRYPAAQFTIAGDGPLLPELKNLAQRTRRGRSRDFRRFSFSIRLAQSFLSRAPLPASERNRPRRQPGRRPKLHARSDGQRPAGFRDDARRNSGGDRARQSAEFSSRKATPTRSHASYCRQLSSRSCFPQSQSAGRRRSPRNSSRARRCELLERLLLRGDALVRSSVKTGSVARRSPRKDNRSVAAFLVHSQDRRR